MLNAKSPPRCQPITVELQAHQEPGSGWEHTQNKGGNQTMLDDTWVSSQDTENSNGGTEGEFCPEALF